MKIIYNSINETEIELHSIQSVPVQVTLILYHLLVCCSSLIGDSLVIIGAVRYQAFKDLNRKIVRLLVHMSICDFLMTLFFILPVTMSMCLRRPVYEGFPCFLGMVVFTWTLPVSQVFIALVVVFKVLLLRWPLKFRGVTDGVSSVCCGAVWAVTLAWVVVGYIRTRELEVNIGVYTFFCYTDTSQLTYSNTALQWTISLIYNVVPLLLVTLGSLFILHHLHHSRTISRRAGGRLHWQGTVTVFLTALIFTISAIPSGVYLLTVSSHTASVFGILIRCSNFMNVMSNVYIYGWAVPGFGRFVRLKVLRLRPGQVGVARTSTSTLDENRL